MEEIAVNTYYARIEAQRMLAGFHGESCWRYMSPTEAQQALAPVFYNNERAATWASAGIQTAYDLACKLATLAEDTGLVTKLLDVPLGKRHSAK